MARKTKTRKRHKKGGYASGHQPSAAELAAHRYGIPTHDIDNMLGIGIIMVGVIQMLLEME